MGSTPVILILVALVVAFLVIWLLRSRRADRPAGHHVDSSVTAIGAASEAIRNKAEEVAQTVEDAMAADVAASGAAPGDVRAVERNSAALMASGSAAAGGIAFTDIGVPAAAGEPDDLRRIKGLGPKLNGLLAGLGITRYDQIAGWGDREIALVDAQLGNFKGRIVRDNWVEQAKFLASGDADGFEAKFGKLDKPGQA
ncbi:MAG TPA: hypothetical protein VNS79_06505 [Sphingobium sp.]|nr:hypothetical protein [Sphingobium sp.]